MASSSNDPLISMESSLSQTLSLIGSFNCVVLMGDSLSGKTLLMARMIEPDLAPDGNYTPTNGFAKYVVETPLGEAHVLEVSGQTDTWEFELDSLLDVATIVVVLKSGEKSDMDWSGMVTAIKPNLPVFEIDNVNPEYLRGLLTGVVARTYPVRDLFDPAAPIKRAFMENLLKNYEKEIFKNIRRNQKGMDGMSLIFDNMVDEARRNYVKTVKHEKMKEKRHKKKSQKHRSKKSKAKSNL